MKEDASIIQQKSRPILIHLRDRIADEIKRLIRSGYLERATERTQYCLVVSPDVITVKKDKSVKITLDSLNEATIKRKAQMPNKEKLISRISRKIWEEKDGQILITSLDFDFAHGQLDLDKATINLCIFIITWGEFT